MIILEYLGIFFLLDAWLYFVHVFMHRFTPRMHSLHHEEYSPKFHLGETMLCGWPPTIVLAWFGHYLLAIVILILFAILVDKGHDSGGEGPSAWDKLFVSNYYHKKHHVNPKANLSQMTPLWDWLMGTRE